MISSKRASSSRRERPSSVPLIRTLSRAFSSGLKPTPSSMNGESRPSMRTEPLSAR